MLLSVVSVASAAVAVQDRPLSEWDTEDLTKYVGATELQVFRHQPVEHCRVHTEVNDIVEIRYIVRLTNNAAFPDPAHYTFKLGGGQVIEAFDLGLLGMCLGEHRRLIVPPQLGFGENEYLPEGGEDDAHLRIAANSVVIFDVELLKLLAPGHPTGEGTAEAVLARVTTDGAEPVAQQA